MKKRRSQMWKRLRRRSDDPETTRRYTPQDELALSSERKKGEGILRSTARNPRVPGKLEEIGQGDQTNHPHRVMLVIVLLALAFIAIIAYFVARMPVKQ